MSGWPFLLQITFLLDHGVWQGRGRAEEIHYSIKIVGKTSAYEISLETAAVVYSRILSLQWAGFPSMHVHAKPAWDM